MASAVLEAGDLVGPAVVLDGALGIDLSDGRAFHQVTFPAGAARQVLEAFTAAGLSPCVYVDRPRGRPGDRRAALDIHSTWPAQPFVATDDLAQVVATEPVFAFAVVGRPALALAPVLGAVGAVGSASIVHDLIYGGSTLQVRPPGINKWSGVLAFCADQGIDPGRVLAIGDGANDLELLEGAAVACAVATAVGRPGPRRPRPRPSVQRRLGGRPRPGRPPLSGG